MDFISTIIRTYRGHGPNFAGSAIDRLPVGPFLLLLPAAGAALYAAYWHNTRAGGKWTHAAQREASRLLAEVDMEVEDELEDLLETVEVDEDDVRVVVPNENRTRFVRVMVNTLRGSVGMLERTKANHLVISAHARKIMSERGMRPSHIGVMLPRVIDAYFLPSRLDVIRRRVQLVSMVRERRELMMNPIYDGFWNWVLRRPVPEYVRED